MRLRTTGLCLALATLAACSSAPTDQPAAVTGAGGTTASAVIPGSAEDLAQNVGDRVFFSLDRSELTAEAKEVLQKQAEWLKQYAALSVVIEGHCDERGTREHNFALDERRAHAAKEYLTSLGVDAHRVETISYGKEKPFVSGSTEEAWAQNRVSRTTLK